MTAAASSTPPDGRGRTTWTDATPAEVRAALAPESAEEFDRHWREALSRAADTYDLSVVQTCLESWRRVARVTAAAGGPEGYRALRGTAAVALEGHAPAVRRAPWREVRADLGLQVAYEVDVGSVHDTLSALPREALVALAEAVTVLELAPWTGAPLVDRNPGGAVRTLPFGDGGLVTYVVVEEVQRVDLLQVHWVG